MLPEGIKLGCPKCQDCWLVSRWGGDCGLGRGAQSCWDWVTRLVRARWCWAMTGLAKRAKCAARRRRSAPACVRARFELAPPAGRVLRAWASRWEVLPAGIRCLRVTQRAMTTTLSAIHRTPMSARKVAGPCLPSGGGDVSCRSRSSQTAMAQPPASSAATSQGCGRFGISKSTFQESGCLASGTAPKDRWVWTIFHSPSILRTTSV